MSVQDNPSNPETQTLFILKFHRIAALLTPKGKYFCGGTVVSSHKVVTGKLYFLKSFKHPITSKSHSQLLTAFKTKSHQ